MSHFARLQSAAATRRSCETLSGHAVAFGTRSSFSRAAERQTEVDVKFQNIPNELAGMNKKKNFILMFFVYPNVSI